MWLLLVTCFWACSTAYEILYAINCGGLTDITVDSIAYSADRYYTENTHTVYKNYISRSVKDSNQRLLIRNERASSSNFSYLLPIRDEGRFGLVLRFYEYEFGEPGLRVFNVRFGEQFLFQIDIVEEAGVKKGLSKFVEFDIKGGIAYLKSLPALNAFDFSEKVVHLNFQKAIGNPKIQSIIVLKGSISQFKKKHSQQSKEKSPTGPIDFLCERLHDATHNNVYTDDVGTEEANPYYFLHKIFCTKAGLLSILVFVIILSKQRLFRQLQLRIGEIERRYKDVYVKMKERHREKDRESQKEK